MSEIYSLREWATETGQSYWFWWKLAKAGKLPCIRTAGKILVRRATVEAWMSEQERSSVGQTEKSTEYGTLRRVE